MSDRPAVPAEIRRRVLVEAGHRCAIPTCRDLMIEVHHIVPWAQVQVHEYENLIALCPTCHAMATKGQIDQKAMRLYKYNLRFAHDKFSQVEMDILFQLAVPLPNGGQRVLQWPAFNVILLKRLIDAGYVDVVTINNGSSHVFGMEITPRILRLTDAGMGFLQSIGEVEF